MPRPSAHSFRRFLVRLGAGYLVLAALWFLAHSRYDLILGHMAAPMIRAGADDTVQIRRIWVDDKLRFDLQISSRTDHKVHIVKPGVDPVQFGFAHVTFAALAFAIGGWTWRRRLLRWAMGAAFLQAVFIGLLVAQLFGGLAQGAAEVNPGSWSGDIITRFIPYSYIMQNRDFLAIAIGQFAPVLLWLGLFFLPSQMMRQLTPGPNLEAIHTKRGRITPLETTAK